MVLSFFSLLCSSAEMNFASWINTLFQIYVQVEAVVKVLQMLGSLPDVQMTLETAV